MHGGMRTNAGRPALWNKSYKTYPVRLPEELKEALLNARAEQIPVEQMVQSLQGIKTNHNLFYK